MGTTDPTWRICSAVVCLWRVVRNDCSSAASKANPAFRGKNSFVTECKFTVCFIGHRPGWVVYGAVRSAFCKEEKHESFINSAGTYNCWFHQSFWAKTKWKNLKEALDSSVVCCSVSTQRRGSPNFAFSVCFFARKNAIDLSPSIPVVSFSSFGGNYKRQMDEISKCKN